MKPLYLKLENINSFREEQTVDFESLTKGERIFCISGDTGSGKSTIFTAMLLYFIIDRRALNSKTSSIFLRIKVKSNLPLKKTVKSTSFVALSSEVETGA